jgi:hypothetical protein
MGKFCDAGLAFPFAVKKKVGEAEKWPGDEQFFVLVTWWWEILAKLMLADKFLHLNSFCQGRLFIFIGRCSFCGFK